MMLPPVTDARRADNAHVGESFFPRRVVSARVAERFSPDRAPDPVRDSDFIGGHGTGVLPSRQQISLTEDIARWSEWEQDRFRGSHFKVFFRAMANRNLVESEGQGPWGHRMNIDRPQPGTYGAEFTVEGDGGEGYYFPGGR